MPRLRASGKEVSTSSVGAQSEAGAVQDGAGAAEISANFSFVSFAAGTSASDITSEEGLLGRKTGSMRILLVEDHTDSRNALRRLLEKWGHDVTEAENLETGVALLRAGHFDAILSDIALPDGTGYALVSEARRHADKVLAIAMSAYRYPEEVYVAKLTGFNYHL